MADECPAMALQVPWAQKSIMSVSCADAWFTLALMRALSLKLNENDKMDLLA
jgi:hypothetical protein